MSLGPVPLAIGVVVLSILFVLRRKAEVTLDPREPPIALSKIPFFGHIYGMNRYQIDYFGRLSAFINSPIFTLKIFATRIYIVQAPSHVALVLRASKTLSLDPFTIAFTKNALRVPLDVSETIVKTPYMEEIHNHMYSSLTPGLDLEISNARVLNALSKFLVPCSSTGLYAFVKKAYTIAGGEALYGVDNPVPSHIDDIWAFEDALGLMILGFYPQIICRKAYLGQLRVQKSFKAYYDAGLDANANRFIRGRAEIARKYGISNHILGVFEITLIFAAVTNIVPTVFWLLSFIYSDPKLLADLREEVTVLGNPVDITKLRLCPLLCSTFQETQRLRQHGNAVRFVKEDTMLDGYLLKKDSIIQIPSSILNTADETWGADAASFDARRFLDMDDKKTRQRGFIPFGGGRNLCPGRHLAFTEALGFVAAMVAGFDIEGVEVIQVGIHKMGSGARKPKGDLPVSIKWRKGFEDVKWSFQVGATP